MACAEADTCNMSKRFVSNPVASDPQIVQLAGQLKDFYSSTDSYTAFQAPVDQSQWHTLCKAYVVKMIDQHSSITILEVGAGRTSFSSVLAEARSRVEYHVQDITTRNYNYLRHVADKVWMCDVKHINSCYDIVLSTFVLEHIPSPSDFLQHVRRLIKPGGLHIVFCPSYVLPGYICPSLRHLSKRQQVCLHAKLLFENIRAAVDHQPRFFVNTDPAVFHMPWFRDADAIHCVTEPDLIRWHQQHDFRVSRIAPGKGVTQRIKRWMITALVCQKYPLGTDPD